MWIFSPRPIPIPCHCAETKATVFSWAYASSIDNTYVVASSFVDWFKRRFDERYTGEELAYGVRPCSEGIIISVFVNGQIKETYEVGMSTYPDKSSYDESMAKWIDEFLCRDGDVYECVTIEKCDSPLFKYSMETSYVVARGAHKAAYKKAELLKAEQPEADDPIDYDYEYGTNLAIAIADNVVIQARRINSRLDDYLSQPNESNTIKQ